MQVDAKTVIQADRETVWKALIDKENIMRVIPGIEKIEVLEKPKSGVVGLKWTETRTLFGKSASATMWITEASDLEFYRTRCEEGGAVYQSSYELKPVTGGTELAMRFKSQSVTFGTKVFSLLLGWAFVGITRKAMEKDLADIKASLEGKAVKAVS